VSILLFPLSILKSKNLLYKLVAGHANMMALAIVKLIVNVFEIRLIVTQGVLVTLNV